jgi:hypothetical protein
MASQVQIPTKSNLLCSLTSTALLVCYGRRALTIPLDFHFHRGLAVNFNYTKMGRLAEMQRKLLEVRVWPVTTLLPY